MTLINVTNVQVLDNPTNFTNPFQFEVTFECYPPGVCEELEWKLIYVGSADDSRLDQELDSVLVGPIAVGKNKFVFTAPAPNPALIPDKDIMEVTVILLTGLYKDKEFIRIGYYVNNEYPESEKELREQWEQAKRQQEQQQQQQQQQEQKQGDNAAASSSSLASSPTALPASSSPSSTSLLPPPVSLPRVDSTRLQRNILSTAPRVTRFQIPWDAETKEDQTFQMTEQDKQEADREAEGNTQHIQKEKEEKKEMQNDGTNAEDDEDLAGDEEGDEDEEDEEDREEDDDVDIDLVDDEEEGDEEAEGDVEADVEDPAATDKPNPHKHQRVESMSE